MSKYLSEVSEAVEDLTRQIGAILFVASDGGVSVSDLSRATGCPVSAVKKTLAALSETLPVTLGLEICNLGGQWHMTTSTEMSDVLERYQAENESSRVKLSKAALETLAVVAYGQPVTRSEIDEIRGVRSDRALETLLGHGLVRIAGRRKATGSPLLYRTTSRFLRIFGLGAISDLPTIAEIEELRRGIESVDGSEEAVSSETE